MKTEPLKTRWTDRVSEENVWKEYPRPAMVRDSYLNLNGYWDYCFQKKKHFPFRYEGKILVPFSPEAALSGVMRQLKPAEYLWYHRTFIPPERTGQERLLLHFGAVDQRCRLYINGIFAGNHEGGYLPFHIDITSYLKERENEIHLCVQDASDTSYHSRGKQRLKNGGMFYTAQSGIWQTVWMEVVPYNAIEYLKLTPSYDTREILVRISTPFKCRISFQILLESGIRTYCITSNHIFRIHLEEFHPWSPEHPYLYHVEVSALSHGQAYDTVKSYFALRKCDVQTDSQGVRRLFLNNKPYPQIGVLDQGYWPDGLYTPPCEDAMLFDIQRMKDLGFNMLRKHLKIESERWYYACDRLGMLVWQDMVNGGSSYKHWFVTYLATFFNYSGIQIPDRPHALLSRRHRRGRKEFFQEMVATLRALYSHPCIVCWVPFNEGWGQFHALEAAELIKELDSTRLIDHASGWFDQGGGDIRSIHYYFFSLILKPERRALALTEFGGYTWHSKEHSYSKKEYGYRTFHSKEALTAGYQKLMENLILPGMKKGISATVYTQLSDVEAEVNGIYTYDREILKIEESVIKDYNEKLKSK